MLLLVFSIGANHQKIPIEKETNNTISILGNLNIVEISLSARTIIVIKQNKELHFKLEVA